MSDILDPLDPSPYKVLNVPQDATTAQIRSAHRKLILITHPDKVQDEAEKKIKAEQFHQIQTAYEILIDEGRKQRWDDRALLAKLRAEKVAREADTADLRTPLRRAQTFAAPRSQGPVFEMRGGRIFEERVPKSATMYEEDAFAAHFRAANERPTRKYSERYDEPPSRRTSGRGPEERRKYAVDDEEDYYDRKAREKRQKEETKSVYNEKQKQRDKAKRKDTEAKFTSRKPYVAENVSDSELDDRHYSSKSDSKSRRREDDKRRTREQPRKNKKRTDDAELDHKLFNAHDYIYKSSMSKSKESIDDRKRPGRSRADSYQQTSYPSPPATPTDKDYGRRSSGDDGRRASARARPSRPVSPPRRGSKTKKNIEIVEAPPRKPSLPNSSSERIGTKEKANTSAKREPVRSQTYTAESKSSRKPPPPGPGLARAETMPTIRPTASRNPPSKLKKGTTPSQFDVTDDSSATDSSTDSSSDSESEHEGPSLPRRPTVPSRGFSTVSYKVSASHTGPVVAEPEELSRSRDVSPKGYRRSTPDRYNERPTRTPPTRAATFQEKPSRGHDSGGRNGSYRHMPPLPTSASAREPRERLFGEMDTESSPRGYPDDRTRTPPSYPRRGSEDVDRDAYPGSMNRSGRHRYRGSEIRAS